MKVHFESEVIIPSAVFGHIDVDSIGDLLSSCNVKFEVKGYSDDCVYIESLISSSVRWRLECAIDLLHSLRRLVKSAAYSVSDGVRCESWLYGEIRVVDND